jgi:hypothetical protein
LIAISLATRSHGWSIRDGSNGRGSYRCNDNSTDGYRSLMALALAADVT